MDRIDRIPDTIWDEPWKQPVRQDLRFAASDRPSCVPWEEGGLPSLAEAEVAVWMSELGYRVLEHRGRYWMASKPGFYQPVHPLASLRIDEATAPALVRWGFRARLAEQDTAAANANMPVHMLPELAGYSESRLTSKRRGKIKHALKEIEIIALNTPDILLQQGYRVVQEANALNCGNTRPAMRVFRRWAISNFAPKRSLILAGVRDGRLLGFCSTWLAGGVVYQDKLFVSAEGRRHDLPLCLFHASATIAAGHPEAREMMNGFHLRQLPGVTEFKRGLTLSLVGVPARVVFAPAAGPLRRGGRPNAYYRLTGRD